MRADPMIEGKACEACGLADVGLGRAPRRRRCKLCERKCCTECLDHSEGGGVICIDRESCTARYALNEQNDGSVGGD